jgi:T-complex protein 1 subunit eta
MFCAGRVDEADLKRTMQACGGSIQTTVASLTEEVLGMCEDFEEIQIGGERYNLFRGCPKAKTCTIIMRGGAEQFIEETERSLHDAIMIVRRAIKNDSIVAGEPSTPFLICLFHESWHPQVVEPLRWN